MSHNEAVSSLILVKSWDINISKSAGHIDTHIEVQRMDNEKLICDWKDVFGEKQEDSYVIVRRD